MQMFIDNSFIGDIKMTTKTETTGRVATLLDSLKNFQWSKRGYDDRNQQYVYCSPLCPAEQMPIGTVLEPVVRSSEWDLGGAGVLTVNHDGRLILNSRNLLTLDMDNGDRRYNKWAVRDTQQVIHFFHDIAALDEERRRGQLVIEGIEPEPLPFLWAEQIWKVYSTQGGTRVICTSLPFSLGTHENAAEFMALCRFLGVDPIYAEKCREQQCYRARLSPKYSGDNPVCNHVATLWRDEPPHPALRAQIELHDEVTSYWSH